MTNREQKLRIKAQEVIDLLKEYLPEYKEAFDLYDPDKEYCLDISEEETECICGEFTFILGDPNETYVLDITNASILKCIVSTKEVIRVAKYLDREKYKTCTYQNPWTWDDAIEEIKRQIADRKTN